MSEKEEVEGGVRITVDREKYTKGRSAAGSSTLHNGDAVAVCLNGMTLEEVTALAGRLKIEIPDYSHLNVGMQRMNIGNKIRKAVNEANKAEEDSGFALLEDKSRTIRAKADKRLEKADTDRQAKKDAAAEKKAAEAEKEAEAA